MNHAEIVPLVNDRLSELIDAAPTYDRLREAMRYSISAGGKRLRPSLHILTNAMLGGSVAECLDMACAIEMIHTYSLIHDDLPAMDNDTLRRGRPTNHVVFGEAMAILAGDALLSYAFEVMLRNAAARAGGTDRHLMAMNAVANGCGTGGMLAGQAADISLEGEQMGLEQLEYVHGTKTGALITSSIVSGALLAGADDEQIAALRAFGTNLGLAFQITDDVLDAVGDADVLGKTPGKDSEAGKCTFASVYGVDGARKIASQTMDRALVALGYFPPDAAAPLTDLAVAIGRRDR